MRKALGLFAFTSFLALGLWLFLPTETPRNLSAQTGTAQVVAPPPRPIGDTADRAVPVGDVAAKSTAVGTAGAVIHRRVRQQLDRATAEFQRGNRAEALRLALTAQQIARVAELTFAEGETTPADLIAQLQSPVAQVGNLLEQSRAASAAGNLSLALNLAAQADRQTRNEGIVLPEGSIPPSQLVAALEIKLLGKINVDKGRSIASLVETRVSEYLMAARRLATAGKPNEALRLAMVAKLMAESQKLTFPATAMTPDGLIAQIETGQSTIRPDSQPKEAIDPVKVLAKAPTTQPVTQP
ncbi:MAG: hypothetical protein QF363_03650, partial [Planctomycetaceae bacterium]|nr:hypothetical protein [Planctomycetaceae bacterium]